MTSARPYVPRGPLPELTLKDVQSFFLTYMENEYSSRSAASRMVHDAMHFNVRPDQERRWIDIGQTLLPPNEQMGPIGANGEPDAKQLADILIDLMLPAKAVLQFAVVIEDFAVKRRFSRVWTKLDRTAQWGALAARLVNDQVLLHGLFQSKTEGFLMSSHPAEVARANIQAVAKSKFISIKDEDSFQVSRPARLRQQIPLRSTFGQVLIHESSSIAFQLMKIKRPMCWEHHRRELIDLEDIQDIADGEALRRHIRWEHRCNECGCRHRFDLTLLIAHHDDLANADAIPPVYSAEDK